jgi:hypothetical protein
MQVPVGFLGKLWSFVSFLPFFILLLLLGSVKGNSRCSMHPFHVLWIIAVLCLEVTVYDDVYVVRTMRCVNGLLFPPPAAVLIGPVAAAIVFVGNSAVIIGLWPAHFIWTYYCVLK